MLEMEDHRVKTTQNGPDGYWTTFQFRPNLVITDIPILVENGLELMHHIREYDPQIKTIYISGNLNEFYSILQEEERRSPVNFLTNRFPEKD